MIVIKGELRPEGIGCDFQWTGFDSDMGSANASFLFVGVVGAIRSIAQNTVLMK